MHGRKTLLLWALVWMLAAGVVTAGTEAPGWIEWSPSQGLYWTEQAREQAAVRIVDDDQETLRALFRALERLTVQEQARLMEQIRTRFAERGPLVIDPESLLETPASPEAERLREQLRTQQALQVQDQERARQTDAADGDPECSPDRQRDGDQNGSRDQERGRERDPASDDAGGNGKGKPAADEDP